MRRKFASRIASESPYLQICMLCRFLHRFPSVRYLTFYGLLHRAPGVSHERRTRKQFARRSRAVTHPPISSRPPSAFSIFFFQSAAYCAVGAFNASTICIIPGRKSRKARHRCDHLYLFTHDILPG